MKKLMIILFFAIVALNTQMVNGDNSSPKPTPVSIAAPLSDEGNKGDKVINAEADRMMARLKEIKEMDRKNMTKEEKRELRKEVYAIRDKLRKERATYVYISGAGLL